MHLFIPYFDAVRTDAALQEACQILQSGDRVTLMASVIVPAHLPVDVEAGEIWKRVCRAEQRMFHAREMAERILPAAISFRCVRVQARNQAAAILAGIENYQPDCTLLALPHGIRGALALHFGTIPTVIRNAPCSGRFVGLTTSPKPSVPVAVPDSAAPLSVLQIIAVNPALIGSGMGNKAYGRRKGTMPHERRDRFLMRPG